MPFGRRITVSRRVEVAGKAHQIRMRPFNGRQARAMVPFAPDDPSLPYMTAVGRQTFTGLTPGQFAAYYRNSATEVSWGIFHGGTLAGVTGVNLEGVGLTAELFLAPAFRYQGIGEMTVAGLAHAVFTKGFLRASCKDMPERSASLGVFIHPDNVASHTMARRAGFVYEGRTMFEEDGGRYPMREYQMGNPAQQWEQERQQRGALKTQAMLAQYDIAAEELTLVE